MVESPNALNIPFQVFDSLCSDKRGQQCHYLTGYRSVFYFAAWAQNPDASKINQPVLRVPSSGESNTSQDNLVFESRMSFLGADASFLPLSTQGMPAPQITCPDFSWLPGGTSQAPTTLTGQRWDSEFMLPNPETSANENRTFATVFNVQWSRSDAQTLTLKSVGGFSAINNSVLGVLIFGDVTTAYLKDQKGGLCSVEFKPGSFAEAGNIVQKIEAGRVERSKETSVYLAGSDESSIEAIKGVKGDVTNIHDLLERFKNLHSENVQ